MKTIRRTGIAGLSGGIVALIMALALPRQVAHGASQSPPAPSVRDVLTTMPVAPALQQAVNRYRQADPTASFTWLRGHVDSFSARPRPTVPDYARPILLKYGLSIVPTSPVDETTSDLPNDSHDDPTEPIEEPSSENIGFDGPSDPGPGTTSHPSQDPPKIGRLTTWYEQTGESAVREVLAAFLSAYQDVFEVPANLLTEQLPNLRLVRYGVGKQGRRAQFEQSIGTTPVLNSKTIVWFDLNWNVMAISRQLMTDAKLPLAPGPTTTKASAVTVAANAVSSQFQTTPSALSVAAADLGIDVVRGTRAWQVQLTEFQSGDIYSVMLAAANNEVLNVSDDTARYQDAKVSRWNYLDGNLKTPDPTIETVYTHDDNTLVHHFFYIVNDDRNDGGDGECTSTSNSNTGQVWSTRTTPNAYGTTTSTEYIRPTRESNRDFALWNPYGDRGSFGETHVYYWARKYVLWQKQALVDQGVLTTGNFNDYKKALIIVNACSGGNGKNTKKPPVSTLDDVGEGLRQIVFPDRCRSGTPAFGNGTDCSPTDYADGKTTHQYTFDDSGGYHSPGVIAHELNHFLLQDYFDVPDKLDCSARNEARYFQEGGLGRTLAQMFWHHVYDVGYLPDWVSGDPKFTKAKLFQSDDVSGRPHNPDDASSLNEISQYACGAVDTSGKQNPYAWGGVVSQPMWEIYHGKKVDGTSLLSMGRPADDVGMIRAMYYAADMATATNFPERFELANRFMEFWELFSNASAKTKGNWCDVWAHHGMNTYIDVDYCS